MQFGWREFQSDGEGPVRTDWREGGGGGGSRRLAAADPSLRVVVVVVEGAGLLRGRGCEGLFMQ